MIFTYDPNGNLWSDGSNSYTYDAENRLITASGAHSATLSYDPLGRLFNVVSGGVTTQFLYDGDALVAEYNGSTGALLRRYVHGPGEDTPLIWYEGATVAAAIRRSLQANHQGSIVSIADSSGNSLGINTYNEYGVPGPNNAGRFQFTGQAMIPELNLYYYKARFYSSTLGRFLQTDPVGYSEDLDLYTYVGNDPNDHEDPTGAFLVCSAGRCQESNNVAGTFRQNSDRDEDSDEQQDKKPGKPRSTVTTNTYAANETGLNITLIGTVNGGNYTDFNWVQTVTTNAPLPGKPANRPYPDTDPGQKTPFYWNPTEQAQYEAMAKSLAGSTVFSDRPSRNFSKTAITWHANLSLVGIKKDGSFDRLKSFTYGFTLDARGVHLEPLRPAQ